MRKTLAILTVVALFSTVASAQLFYPTRDAAINKVLGSQYASGGAMTECRILNGRQQFLLMDFDWVGIEAAGAAYAAPVYEISMVPVDPSLNGARARIVMSSNYAADWVEADGTSQFTEFTWSSSFVNPAVTSQFAQSYQDRFNPGSPDMGMCIGPWPWGGFDELRNQSGQYSIQPLVFGLGGVRVYEPLDQSFMDQVFSGFDQYNYPIRGIYAYDVDAGWYTGHAYTSEAGPDLSPLIRVTPEPASLLLIAVGAVAVLIRKRR